TPLLERYLYQLLHMITSLRGTLTSLKAASFYLHLAAAESHIFQSLRVLSGSVSLFPSSWLVIEEALQHLNLVLWILSRPVSALSLGLRSKRCVLLLDHSTR